jgi:phage portal protein BeeE
VEKAFRPAFLGGGADVKMVGANLADLGAKDVTSDAFAKICAAAGVPPVVVTIVPGLESASTYANYQTAMRAFADLTVRPLWLHATLALRKLIPAPSDAELWYDVAGVSALQQDALDDAEVQAKQAATIRTLGDAGWEKNSVRDAVLTGDLARLKDTGLNSVQLIPPGLNEPKALPATNGAGK